MIFLYSRVVEQSSSSTQAANENYQRELGFELSSKNQSSILVTFLYKPNTHMDMCIYTYKSSMSAQQSS